MAFADFMDELSELIAKEEDMSFAEIIGALEITKEGIMDDLRCAADDGDEGEE